MIYFLSDYSLGAHPDVMEALIATNEEHADGYGNDRFTEEASELIREFVGKPEAHIHFMTGGTSANGILIQAALRPYEGVISADSGHIYVHETGTVEAGGHRIFDVPTDNGKLCPEDIENIVRTHENEHNVLPKLVYISQPTELGGVYTKTELKALHDCCRENELLLYADGARLGTALTCDTSDFDIRDMAELTDAFYIGGTKAGALFGEAMVILNEGINDHFRYMLKRAGGMLAKGRLIAVQFTALLKGGEDSLYYRISRRENELAKALAAGIRGRGYSFFLPPETNQIFVIVPDGKIAELKKDFLFNVWCPYDEKSSVVRFVTGWGTEEEEIDALISAL